MALKKSILLIIAALVAEVVIMLIAFLDPAFPIKTMILSTFMVFALSSVGAFSMSSVDVVRKIAIGIGLGAAVAFTWNYFLTPAEKFFDISAVAGIEGQMDDICLLFGGISAAFYAIIFNYYFYWERRHATFTGSVTTFLPASVFAGFDVDQLQGESMDKDIDTPNDLKYLDRFEERAEARNLEFTFFFSFPFIVLDAFIFMYWVPPIQDFYFWGVIIALVVWIAIVFVFWHYAVDEFSVKVGRDNYADAIKNASIAFSNLPSAQKTNEASQFASLLANFRAAQSGQLDKNAKFCIGDVVNAVRKNEKVDKDKLENFIRTSAKTEACRDSALPVAQNSEVSDTISYLFQKVDTAQTKGKLKDLYYRGLFFAVLIIIVLIIMINSTFGD